MKPLPAYTARMLTEAYSSIVAEGMLTLQTATDLYKDEEKRLVKRVITLSSKPFGGKIVVNFTVDETMPLGQVRRIDLDLVDGVVIEGGNLIVSNGALALSFMLAPVEEPEDETGEPNEGEGE